MEPTDTNLPDPYDYNPADAGTDRPEAARPSPANGPAVPPADEADEYGPDEADYEVTDEEFDEWGRIAAAKAAARAAAKAAADEPTPIVGIMGILDKIRRDCPAGMWANLEIPATDADPNPLTEVGVVVSRRDFVKNLDAVGIKLAASEIDALLAMIGYALSCTTWHLVAGAVSFAASRDQMPKEVSEMFATTSGRLASLDGEIAPLIRLAEALVGGNPMSPTERRAARTAHGIQAGSCTLGSLAKCDEVLARLGSLILSDAMQNIARKMQEGGDDAKHG